MGINNGMVETITAEMVGDVLFSPFISQMK